FSIGTAVEFARFPGEPNLDIEIPPIDLSMTTLHGFIELSRNLSVNTGWTAIPVPMAALNPVGEPTNAKTERNNREPANTKIERNNREAAINPLDRMETNVDRIEFKTPALAPVAFLRFCARYSEDCKVRSTSSDHAFMSLTKE